MTHPTDFTLSAALRMFLGEYLPHQKAYSIHTILSYRDSLKLLLQFAAGERGRVCDLSIKSLDLATIRAFLESLETKRHNGPATRNVRLGAIHSFFQFLCREFPEYLDQAQHVLGIPFKRTSSRIIDYLDADEIHALLEHIDRSTLAGRRDYVLLALMFNTGARVQEIVSLQTTDVRTTTPASVTFFGKGRKERICPLWPETANLVKEYFHQCGFAAHEPQSVFRNQHGGTLTRFGARLILQRHIRRAAVELPSLKRKRIHPHSLRHSTAIHLLKSGVDLSTIAHWMGHSSINTTHKYVSIDLEDKRAAIAKARPLASKSVTPSRWHPDEDILKWLESL
jgi:site-specific recombinase XerD